MPGTYKSVLEVVNFMGSSTSKMALYAHEAARVDYLEMLGHASLVRT